MEAPERAAVRAVRYDAVIATFIGVLALGVSAYTALLQRQQVRAQVWPYLELSTSNVGTCKVVLSNKGVGPALVKEVEASYDGRPVVDWSAFESKTLDSQTGVVLSTLSRGVLSPGESRDAITFEESGDAGRDGRAQLVDRFGEAYGRLSLQICYCSPLGECWLLSHPENERAVTTERPSCPSPSARSFQQ